MAYFKILVNSFFQLYLFLQNVTDFPIKRIWNLIYTKIHEKSINLLFESSIGVLAEFNDLRIIRYRNDSLIFRLEGFETRIR